MRAYVGAGDARVDGAASDASTATLVIDYDIDDDGLIEISSLAQLQASRLDSDGDGLTDDPAMQGFYTLAFPDAAPGMGRPTPGCHGYELATDDLTLRPEEPGPVGAGGFPTG